MDSKQRSRANSELLMSSRLTNSHRSWIAEAFQRYYLQQHSTDAPHPRHIEPRYLGTATIQLGPQCFPKASFYEITESEISEQGLERKHARTSSTQDTTVSPFQDQLSPLDEHEHLLADGSKLSTDCCSASETSCGRSDCAYLSLSESIAATTLIEKYVVEDDSGLHNKSSLALPPKKRKRRRILRQDIIFSFADHDEDELPSDADYYCFPKDALVETQADDPPFEVVVSFQLCKTMLSEDFMDSVCPGPQLLFNDRQPAFLSDAGYQNLSFSRTSHRRFTDPGQKPMTEIAFQTMQLINLRLSTASHLIYAAIKKSVSRFETLCHRMVELSKHHHDKITHRKSEELSVSRSISTSKSLQPEDEDDEMDDKHHGYESTDTICKIDNWSSDENGWDKDSHIDGSARATSVSATSDIHMDTSMSGHKSSGSDVVPSPKLSASLPSKLPSNGLHGNKQNKQQTLSNGSLKKCLYCGSKSTPMWRRGPQGAGTLCNACGVKWKHGKILCGVTATDGNATISNADNGGHKERKGSKADKKRKKAEATAAKKEKRPKVKNRKGKKAKMEGVEEDPNAFTHGMELDEDEDSNVEPIQISEGTPKGDVYLYDEDEDDDDSSTLAGQDHMDIQTAVKAEPVFAIPFARTSSSSDRHTSTPAQHNHSTPHQPLLQPARSTWDTIYSSSSSSSTSELFSPRESYASSPNSSPSSLLLDVHQSDKRKPSQGFVNALALAQSAADDAVEAATVLTMLRSS